MSEPKRGWVIELETEHGYHRLGESSFAVPWIFRTQEEACNTAKTPWDHVRRISLIPVLYHEVERLDGTPKQVEEAVVTTAGVEAGI